MKLPLFLLAAFCLFLCLGCDPRGAQDEEPIEPTPGPETGVKFNLAEVPYPRLSDYRFFTGTLAEMNPNQGLLLYKPIATLFSDYAEKIRYVYLPNGGKAAYRNDHEILDFPLGSVIIKTFYYDHVQPADERRVIETRLLYLTTEGWKFADYTWNEAQTEATYDLNGSNTPVSFRQADGRVLNVSYRIPSEAECLTCHKRGDVATPIGPKPQNLNSFLDFPDGSRSNQLSKWFNAGYLQAPADLSRINTVVDYHDPAQDLTLRIRSYLDMNCAHCHAEGGHCDYRPLRLAFRESALDLNLGICVEPEEVIPGENLTYLVSPGNGTKSTLLYRLLATAENVRMPLLGRSVVHTEATEMISEWIENLEQRCN